MRHILFTFLALIVALVPTVGAQGQPTPEERLRDLWSRGDGELRAIEGRRFIDQKGASLETRAWYVTAASNATFQWYRWPVASVIEGMKAEASGDAWTLLAQASAAPNIVERIAHCDKALAATKDRYILVMCTEVISSTITGETPGVIGDERLVEAFIEKYRDRFEENADTMASKAFGTLRLTGAREKGVPGNRENVYKIIDHALSMDPNNVRAISYRSNSFAAQKRFREVIDTLGPVLEAGGRSGQLHRAYVSAVNQIEMPDTEKARLIEIDLSRLAESGDVAPRMFGEMLQTLNNYSPEAEKRVMARFLERHPHTSTAESITVRLLELKRGAYREWTDLPAEIRREVAKDTIAFLQDQKRTDPWAEQRANDLLVGTLLWNGDADAAQLWAAFQLARDDHGYRFVRPLLDQGFHIAQVKEICERTIDKMILKAQKRSIEWKTNAVGRFVESVHWNDTAGWYAALADAEVRLGRLKEAEARLHMAQSLNQNLRNDIGLQLTLVSAGLYQAKKDFAKAESYLNTALAADWSHSTEHPAIAAFQKLYLARTGSRKGLDRYMAAALEKERSRRRDKVLATRKKSPVPVPDFSLKTIDGRFFASSDLRGKVAVVNFWGVWCPPCREEMPVLQKVYEKYKDDPRVAIVTIDSRDGLGLLKSYLAKNRITLPVLLEGDYVSKAGVDTFPTTWFLDAEGRLIFEKIGVMDELDLELRLDALLKK